MAHTVLLVDDDPNVLAALRRAFRHEPYQIVVAESGSAALSVLARESVDVVVSDHGMPGMLGTEFLARVRATHPDVIRMILTGQRDINVAVRAINEGEVYRFFTKPTNPAELCVTIRQALQHRQLLVQNRRLLQTVRRQSALMDQLDRQFPGLTHVARDGSGAVVVDDVPADLDALLSEVETELAAADRRFGSSRRNLER